MTDIQLVPELGGEPIAIPKARTVIGRGPFMKVTDKRVSRNHANIDVNEKNQLVITPIHTNPCFLKATESGEKITLPKDKPQVLQDGDILGLLPDSLYYRVIYNASTKTQNKINNTSTANNQSKTSPASSLKSNDQTPEKKANLNNSDTAVNEDSNANSESDASPVKTVKQGNHDVALPLEKSRVLPKWMVGASKRVDIRPKTTEDAETPTKSKIANNAQALSECRQAKLGEEENDETTKPTPKRGRHSAPKKRAQESEDEGEEEISRTRGGSERRHDMSGSEDLSEEEVMVKKREPRMSAGKLLTYKDEFDLSDVLSASSGSEVGGQFGSHRKDDDSDFVVDEPDLESGSDWEVPRSQNKAKRGRRRSQNSTPRRRSTRKGRKSYNYDDSDDFSSDDEAYVPRPSKRRTSNVSPRKGKSHGRKSRKVDTDSEEYSSEEEVKPARGKRKNKQASSDDDDDDYKVKTNTKKRGRKFVEDESEDEKPRKKGKSKADISEEESENEKPAKKAKHKADVSEEESEENASPKKKGRKNGNENTKKGGRKFAEDESEDEKPTKKGKSKADVSEEESENEKPEEIEENASPKKKGGQNNTENDNETDTKNSKTAPQGKHKRKGGKRRKLCYYAAKCYRKNPKHFEDFCHPGDSTYDEDEGEEEPKPARPAREKDKKSVLAGASDDDGEANTYAADSFLTKGDESNQSEESSKEALDESDWDPEEEENVKATVKEARSFLREKRNTKPVRRK